MIVAYLPPDNGETALDRGLGTALSMRNELSYKCAPRPPLCPSCAQIMRLVRITSRFGDLPDRRVAHRGSMSATILIMLVAVVITTTVAWHGRGHWY